MTPLNTHWRPNTTPELARDAGMAATTNAADPRLILAVDRVIAEFNAAGKRWSANDIRDALPVVAGPLVGARVNAAANRKPAEMVRAWIAVWQGVSS